VVNLKRKQMFDYEFEQKQLMSDMFDAQQEVSQEVFFWLRSN